MMSRYPLLYFFAPPKIWFINWFISILIVLLFFLSKIQIRLISLFLNLFCAASAVSSRDFSSPESLMLNSMITALSVWLRLHEGISPAVKVAEHARISVSLVASSYFHNISLINIRNHIHRFDVTLVVKFRLLP